jgi:two-component system OmpR family sensor kinase
VTGGGRRSGDDLLVSRTARVLAAQVAALVALAMLLLVVLVTYVVVRGQTAAADTLRRTTVATADDVGDPPPGAWLVLQQADGRTASSAGLPADLESALARLRAVSGSETHLVGVSDDEGNEYRVATSRVEGRTVQVVLDRTTEHRDRARLLNAMGVASALALLFAGALGILLARRAVRPLAEALTLQRTFVADASHELRTPLTLLSTRAQLLDRSIQRGAVDDQVRADSRGVVHDVQRLGEVVEDLLVAADPRGEDSHELVDLGALVGSVADSAQAHAEEQQVRLVAGAGPDQLWVLGSAAALRRAVLALVDNAIDHTPAGGSVTATVRRERREAVVTVHDTGPGVPPEAAADVLRRFHSGGHRAGRTHYGLGLALTRDVADRHGGQLRLTSQGPGATFELTLPAVEPPP